ncbi:DoxX family protein [Hymenobacter arizonensis]|uniref:DoxX-like family protein n=1 Tax=Hymenobacter arizonensis TaxID=1227077 RepID=A0A1I5Z423_HYMAR|nr:DoxX family protein [Hymenobacter arizonensis]SFQ51202.1 DoxX-like family protein [Hymenobacter arizonensis]
MSLLHLLIYFSSLSFLGYAVSYFKSPHMKNEFKRFGLERVATFTIILEIIGALGLLVGLISNPILLIASGGLAALMFLGVLVRIKVKDSFLVSLPAAFFMVVNAYIFYQAIQIAQSGIEAA